MIGWLVKGPVYVLVLCNVRFWSGSRSLEPGAALTWPRVLRVCCRGFYLRCPPDWWVELCRRALFVDFPLMPLSFFQPITNIVWEFGRRTDVQNAKYAPMTTLHDLC